MSKSKLSSSLDPSRPEHNIARVEEISSSSSAFNRRFSDGTPFFTRVEISITDLCNRKCVFCPRYDESVYPNNNSEISLELYTKIMRDLAELDWQGGLSFSGFGEPMLHTQLIELIETTKSYLPDSILDLITNGDSLTVEAGTKIFNAGLDCIKISLYDGPHQIEHFERIGDALGIDKQRFLLRHRFLGAEDNFGLILSNRAGSVIFSDLPLEPLDEPLTRKCFFPFYKMMIDYDGRVLLCSHDWVKNLHGGDLNLQGIEEIWTGRTMQRVRQCLSVGNRSFKPCAGCDVDGTLNGRSAFDNWLDAFSS